MEAGAQSAAGLKPEQRGFLERLALAKARADLLEQVYGLAVSNQFTVGNWAAREVSRDRAVRLWIRSQPRFGAARFYSDATADVDVRLDPRVLLEQLERLRQAHPARESEPIDVNTLRQAAQHWSLLWGAGTASLAEKPRARKPEGWEDVTYEGIQVVRRAAEADARHALLERAAELQVTNARRLREFLDSSDAVRDAVLAALERAADVSVTFELDQVAIGQARISLIDLIRVLTDVHQKHYRGDSFHAADFRGMALLAGTDEVAARGLAIPPSSAILRARYRPLEFDVPGWIPDRVTAVGRYEVGGDDPLNEAERVEAARLDGIDRLRQQVEALVIQEDVTVEQFLGYHDELKDDVVVFLSGARLAGSPQTPADGIIEVPVELPLRRLWQIIRRGMKRIEVDSPVEPTTEPGERGAP